MLLFLMRLEGKLEIYHSWEWKGFEVCRMNPLPHRSIDIHTLQCRECFTLQLRMDQAKPVCLFVCLQPWSKSFLAHFSQIFPELVPLPVGKRRNSHHALNWESFVCRFDELWWTWTQISRLLILGEAGSLAKRQRYWCWPTARFRFGFWTLTPPWNSSGREPKRQGEVGLIDFIGQFIDWPASWLTDD